MGGGWGGCVPPTSSREPDDAARLVDFLPGEAEDLILAPPGVVGEVEDVLPRGWEVGADGEVFVLPWRGGFSRIGRGSRARCRASPSGRPRGHPGHVLEVEREQPARQVQRMQHGQAIRLVEVRGDLGEPAVRGVAARQASGMCGGDGTVIVGSHAWRRVQCTEREFGWCARPN